MGLNNDFLKHFSNKFNPAFLGNVALRGVGTFSFDKLIFWALIYQGQNVLCVFFFFFTLRVYGLYIGPI